LQEVTLEKWTKIFTNCSAPHSVLLWFERSLPHSATRSHKTKDPL